MENAVAQQVEEVKALFKETHRDTRLDIEKIEAILLNKVKRLKWSYFDLNLDELVPEGDVLFSKSDFYRGFLDDIQPSGWGSYAFEGNTRKYSNLKTEALHSVLVYIKQHPEVLKEVTRRLFDINPTDGGIVNESAADQDVLGKFNQRDRALRNELFRKRMREGKRDENHIVIMAEGDSWFEFPRVYLKIDPVKDIIDWLIEDDTMSVYSLAAGGDWLSNILYLGEYIEELPKISPDVFLISGGGNDLVGNHRLATMVRNPHMEGRRPENDPLMQRLRTMRAPKKGGEHEHINLAHYERGLSLIADEFFQFLNLCLVQYFVFFTNLKQTRKFDKMLILTQGYDYVKPTHAKRGNWLSVQRIVNSFTDTGKWLYEPLNTKGIIDEEDQEAVMYTMIYEFNEMLIQLANYHGFGNVFHIDCRGVAGDDDWFDELHLKSASFEKIAEVYRRCIRENRRQPGEKKVYRVARKR